MQMPHLDELVDGLHGGLGFLPFLRYHLGSLFCVTFSHFVRADEIWISLFRKAQGGRRRMARGSNCWVGILRCTTSAIY